MKIVCVELKTGDVFEIGEAVELEKQENDIPERVNVASFSDVTFDIGHIKMRARLAIMGMPISNNWRKMHGGIMDKCCGRRKSE